jgi:hypothetical protein
MKDTECYVNKAEVKRKIRVWLDYRTSRQVTDGLLDLIEKLPVMVKGQLEATLESDWISVKDRLPDDVKDVIVCDEFGLVYPAYYYTFDGCWMYSFAAERCEHKITHWMPLPEPPESEDDAE